MIGEEITYYMGWIIELTPRGFTAYDRADHSSNAKIPFFGSYGEAKNYVDTLLKK
jgi:hypothetical protein